MRNLISAAIASALLVGALAALPSAAAAQQTAAGSVGSVVDFYTRSPAYQSSLLAAQLSEIARHKGFGPADAYSTTNVGTQNVYSTTTHNGPETSSSADTILNSNATSTSTNVGANSTGITITPTTGSSQYSGQATQVATAQSQVGGTTGSNSSAGVH